MLNNCYNCSLLKVLLTPCGKYGSPTREKAVSKNCPEESLILDLTGKILNQLFKQLRKEEKLKVKEKKKDIPI